jgi:hypothetical protein
LKMNNGAVVKLVQYWLRGHSVWTRVHGSRGMMENLRHGNSQMIRLVREQYHEPRKDPVEQIYLPDFPEHHAEAVRAGHGGGDFFMDFHFAQAIRKNEQPYFDVYKGVTMSVVGILAYRSALHDSSTVEIPDFHKDAVLRKFERDDWSPDPAYRKSGQPWPSILGNIKPGKLGAKYAQRNWRQAEYKQ